MIDYNHDILSNKLKEIEEKKIEVDLKLYKKAIEL